ncbi:MAG: hypothetical protein Q4G30_09070 [Actinomycetaceae bacterium]|nr:hypothetical protein [Actinomycetaceae bacterium]
MVDAVRGSASDPKALAYSLLFGAIVISSIWFQKSAGWLLLAVQTLTSILGISLGIASFAILAIVVDWLTVGRIKQGLALAGLSFFRASFLNFGDLSYIAIDLFQYLIFIGFGLVIWKYKQQQEKLRAVAANAQAEAVEDAYALHHELISELHKGLVATFSRISVGTEILNEAFGKQESKRTQVAMSNVLGGCDHGLAEVRTLMATLKTASTGSHTLAPRSLKGVIENERTVLSMRSISLVEDIPDNLAQSTDTQTMSILLESIHEACTNTLKYAKSSSVMEITIENDGQVISFLATSATDAKRVKTMSKSPSEIEIAKGVSGLFGLAELEQKIQRIGGSMQVGNNGPLWVHYAQMPYRLPLHLQPDPWDEDGGRDDF